MLVKIIKECIPIFFYWCFWIANIMRVKHFSTPSTEHTRTLTVRLRSTSNGHHRSLHHIVTDHRCNEASHPAYWEHVPGINAHNCTRITLFTIAFLVRRCRWCDASLILLPSNINFILLLQSRSICRIPCDEMIPLEGNHYILNIILSKVVAVTTSLSDKELFLRILAILMKSMTNGLLRCRLSSGSGFIGDRVTCPLIYKVQDLYLVLISQFLPNVSFIL